MKKKTQTEPNTPTHGHNRTCDRCHQSYFVTAEQANAPLSELDGLCPKCLPRSATELDRERSRRSVDTSEPITEAEQSAFKAQVERLASTPIAPPPAAQHTPGMLQTRGTLLFHQDNPGGHKIHVAECFRDVGAQCAIANAAELARRWNAHEELLAACRAVLRSMELAGNDDEPRNIKTLRAAIAKATP